MTKIIVRGRAVIRGIKADGSAEVVEDGAVVVDGRKIAAVGRFEDLRALYREAAVAGAGRDVVAPGFVNAHHHVGVTPFQLGAPDLPLELWFAAKLGLRQVDPYLDTLYSAFELLASGVTTVQHLHIARGSIDDVARQADEILRAYRDVGLRVSYSYAFRDQNRLVYEADEDFLRRLPPPLAGALRPILAGQGIALQDYLGWFEALRSAYDGSFEGRAAVQLAPANLHWCSDEALEAIGEAAERTGAPLHIHLLETKYQKAYAAGRSAKSAVRHLRDLGLLGPQTTLGHMVWADDDDLDEVASSGACICHNASSNLRLRSGLAPCAHFIKRAIPTAIGIDEAGLNDDRDMLQEIRLVLHLHRSPGLDETDRPSAPEVFRMATEHGGSTTPFKGTIGRLDPGMAADLVLYDWPAVTGPYLDGSVGYVDAILHRAKTDSVRAVMVAGRWVYQDGRFTLINREDVLRELAAGLARPSSRDEMRRLGLSKALKPFVRGVYESAPLDA